MRNTRSSKALCVFLAVAWTQPASAFFSEIVFDPTHHAATIAEGAKRAADAAREIQVEIQQYQQMVRDGLALADPVFRPIGDTIRGLHSVYMQGQSLMYMSQNMDSMFGMTYPSYYTWLGTMGQGRSMTATMEERYRKWSDTGYENTRSAMMAAGVRVDRRASEQAMLESLVAQAGRADGQKQALDAANQIAGNMAEQMLDLRGLVIENTNLHANFMAHQIEQKTFDNAFNQQFKRGTYQNTRGQGF